MHAAIAIEYLRGNHNRNKYIWQASNIIRQDFHVIAIIAVSCSWSTWLMREVKRKQECARRLLAWLSLAGNARRWWLPATATAYANPRTFAPTAEQTSNLRRISGASRAPVSALPLSTRRVLARVILLSVERHALLRMYVCTNTPTRDGHAPKRSLITSILLPLTAHYRASRESFLLIYVDCRSRKRVERDHQESAPPLEIRVKFPFALAKPHS